jgi:hypothetical protein
MLPVPVLRGDEFDALLRPMQIDSNHRRSVVSSEERMYAPAEFQLAKSTLRVFLRSQPLLHARTQEARIAGVAGWAAADYSQAVVTQALVSQPNSNELCQLLTSDIGQLTLQALSFEFPGWKLVFDLLPIAAQGLCEQRRQGAAQTSAGASLMLAGVGLIVYALLRK